MLFPLLLVLLGSTASNAPNAEMEEFDIINQANRILSNLDICVSTSRMEANDEDDDGQEDRFKRRAKSPKGSGAAHAPNSHGRPKPWSTEDSEELVEKLMAAASILVEAIPFGQIFSNAINLAADLTVRANLQKRLLDTLTEAHDRSMHIAAQVRVGVEHATDGFSQHLNVVGRYAKLRRQIQYLRSSFKLYIGLTKETNDVVVGRFKHACRASSNLMQVVQGIENLFSRPYGRVGGFMTALVGMVKGLRIEYQAFMPELRRDFCQLMFLHGVCNVVTGVSNETIENNRIYILRIFNLTVSTLEDVDRILSLSFKEQADVVLAELSYEKLSDPIAITEALRKKLTWIDVSVLTFSDGDTDWTSMSYANDSCLLIRRFQSKNVVVYFSEIESWLHLLYSVLPIYGEWLDKLPGLDEPTSIKPKVKCTTPYDTFVRHASLNVLKGHGGVNFVLYQNKKDTSPSSSMFGFFLKKFGICYTDPRDGMEEKIAVVFSPSCSN